jgi:hypothetical protein
MESNRVANHLCRQFAFVAWAWSAAAMCGCWRGGGDGPTRYEVTGEVTLNGKPAPWGEIFFQPDAAQKNSGPGTTVRVEKGRFKTRDGKGVSVGPHVVNIIAYDGIPNRESMDGAPLTKKPYVTTVTIPANDSVQNFDVPASHLVK